MAIKRFERDAFFSRLEGIRSSLREWAPGIFVCIVIAMAASFVSEHHGGPALLYALLLGLVMHFLSTNTSLLPGLSICSRVALRVGVALLGARITVHQVVDLGWRTAAGVAFGVCATIAAGLLLARLLERPKEDGILSGCAVGICGASAALAVAAVLPATKENERFTLLTVIGVTLLSTIAMVIYPLFIAWLELDAMKAGIFLGATIHDVAQVIAAGMIIDPRAADTAAIVKLFRVALLAPIVFCIAFAYRRRQASMQAGDSRPPLLPAFLLGFAALVACSSLGWVSLTLSKAAGDISKWFLMMAIAAVGIKTNLAELSRLGWIPVLMLVGETVLIALLALIFLFLG